MNTTSTQQVFFYHGKNPAFRYTLAVRSIDEQACGVALAHCHNGVSGKGQLVKKNKDQFSKKEGRQRAVDRLNELSAGKGITDYSFVVSSKSSEEIFDWLVRALKSFDQALGIVINTNNALINTITDKRRIISIAVSRSISSFENKRDTLSKKPEDS